MAERVAKPTERAKGKAPNSREQQRKEAWRSVGLIYKEVFDVKGVLAGRKKLSDLRGLSGVYVCLGLLALHVWATSVELRLTRRLTEVVYMRDNAAFPMLMLKNIVMAFINESMYYPMRMILSMRMNLVWREHLWNKIHDRYFDVRRKVYLRQQHLPPERTIVDVEDRISRDIEAACGSISHLIFSCARPPALLPSAGTAQRRSASRLTRAFSLRAASR